MEKLPRLLVDVVFPYLFDPNPITFKDQDEDGVESVRTACSSRDQLYKLKESLNRNAFLCGCLDFTENEPIEHLIVGFGYKYGNTTKVDATSHIEGEADYVLTPNWLGTMIEKHLRTGHRAEVLVFHNHPRNKLNEIVDNLPLASEQDRLTLTETHLKPLVALKTLMDAGGIKFYLGENGFVRRFYIPALRQLMDVIDGIGTVNR